MERRKKKQNLYENQIEWLRFCVFLRCTSTKYIIYWYNGFFVGTVFFFSGRMEKKSTTNLAINLVNFFYICRSKYGTLTLCLYRYVAYFGCFFFCIHQLGIHTYAQSVVYFFRIKHSAQSSVNNWLDKINHACETKIGSYLIFSSIFRILRIFLSILNQC